jgi:hypothetical protein
MEPGRRVGSQPLDLRSNSILDFLLFSFVGLHPVGFAGGCDARCAVSLVCGA